MKAAYTTESQQNEKLKAEKVSLEKQLAAEVQKRKQAESQTQTIQVDLSAAQSALSNIKNELDYVKSEMQMEESNRRAQEELLKQERITVKKQEDELDHFAAQVESLESNLQKLNVEVDLKLKEKYAETQRREVVEQHLRDETFRRVEVEEMLQQLRSQNEAKSEIEQNLSDAQDRITILEDKLQRASKDLQEERSNKNDAIKDVKERAIR
eukprot:TRINITY_DN7862_c0_g1_i1.p1 TRINITY_DN7862_c0_g1~~TRINITY_DN7862_c0_g1_i1.p1  ORF type:complete len:211 (+),score=56.77 TRINITY_DN7862_c0_g1_i1:70-702(+)